MFFNFTSILSAFMVLFAVIDIIGSIPIILDIKAKNGNINPLRASLASLAILLLFLFGGERVLSILGVDISSFAIAGSFVVFFVALEMVLGVEIFKQDKLSGASIVPIAFPLIAGAGSITTLLSIRAEYNVQDIIVALVLNILVVFFVLKSTRFFEKILGQTGILILRKIFGIILLAIAIKLFVANTGINIGIKP
ncbi:MAG: hypothetical protein A2033_14375 [Bacteroidetes bacterium GWA2_31_9]|nr:MAG: hypothetical protein A2033_14375 [Bacteroidetes bacterium GWA2_31_9]